ncbi:hypothetical protein [Streptomyces sp. NPDC020362]|uniref:coiled-coil domain-containing protein n=1 Tax=unclassified Streptomyces TaxID=2593676 RepID=UPI00340EB0F1
MRRRVAKQVVNVALLCSFAIPAVIIEAPAARAVAYCPQGFPMQPGETLDDCGQRAVDLTDLYRRDHPGKTILEIVLGFLFGGPLEPGGAPRAGLLEPDVLPSGIVPRVEGISVGEAGASEGISGGSGGAVSAGEAAEDSTSLQDVLSVLDAVESHVDQDGRAIQQSAEDVAATTGTPDQLAEEAAALDQKATELEAIKSASTALEAEVQKAAQDQAARSRDSTDQSVKNEADKDARDLARIAAVIDKIKYESELEEIAAQAAVDASAEGLVPTDSEIASFDGDSLVMSDANKDIWNTTWHDEVMTEVGSDSGQLGKNNKNIKKLLAANGKIGKVPGAADTYTRLVGELANSLADPTKPAADAMVRFGNLLKEFSAPNRQEMEITYLPTANLNNVREAIAAKRMFEAGISDFKPGEPVGTQQPDYTAADGTFVGDAVRLTGETTADGIKSGIKARITDKVTTYADRTGLPVRVVIDASDNPALDSVRDADFENLVVAGVQSTSSQITAKLKDVVVLGPEGMLVQTDPSGRIVRTAHAVRALTTSTAQYGNYQTDS